MSEMKNKPILHLNLKRHWWLMILRGFKTEEYRKQSLYWSRIFTSYIKIKGKRYHPTDVIICFSNGYAKDSDQFFIECKGLTLGFGKKEWGAEKEEQYFIIQLGNKIT